MVNYGPEAHRFRARLNGASLGLHGMESIRGSSACLTQVWEFVAQEVVRRLAGDSLFIGKVLQCLEIRLDLLSH